MKLSEKAREAQNAYKRKWAKENPDKIRAQQERYWAKRAEKAEPEPPQPPAEQA